MRLLAIDTSMSSPGVAILSVKQGKATVKTVSHVKTTTANSHGLRADIIESWLTLFLAQHAKKGFDEVVREDFNGRSSTSNHPVFSAWSACDRALFKFGVEFTAPAITPSRVKLLVTGSGKADKHEVEAAVRKITGYTGPFATDDESDAVAIGLAHLIRKGVVRRE